MTTRLRNVNGTSKPSTNWPASPTPIWPRFENGNKPPSSSVLVVLSEALGLRPHQIHAAADNLTERRQGQTMLLSAQQSSPEVGIGDRVSAMRAAPGNFDRPSDQRRRLIGLLDELSEKDLELLIDLAQRLKAR